MRFFSKTFFKGENEMIITVWECLGDVSLDRKFLEDVVDGKSVAEEVQIETDKQTYRYLKELASRTFDNQEYQTFLNSCKWDEAFEYMRKYGKGLPISGVNQVREA